MGRVKRITQESRSRMMLELSSPVTMAIRILAAKNMASYSEIVMAAMRKSYPEEVAEAEVQCKRLRDGMNGCKEKLNGKAS